MKKKVREWRLNQIENINRQNLWKEFLILELSIIELKSKITEMKNSLEGLSNRFEQAEEGIHELKDKSIDIAHVEKQKDKKWREMDRAWEICGTLSSITAY